MSEKIPDRNRWIALVSATALAVGAQAQVPGETNSVQAKAATESPTFNPFPSPDLSIGTALGSSSNSTNTAPQTVAEIRQKLVHAVDKGQYEEALEYARLGLSLDPRDYTFLKVKAVALMALHRQRAAIAAYQEVLAEEPYDQDVLVNLGELYLLTGDTDGYHKLVAEHRPPLEAAYGGAATIYFTVLESYFTQDESQLRTVTLAALAKLPAKQQVMMGDWKYDELLAKVAPQPHAKKKTILMTFLRAMMGELDGPAAIKLIEGLPGDTRNAFSRVSLSFSSKADVARPSGESNRL